MGRLIDGIFASEHIDSSGEILSVEGCDISTLDKDGTANFEHNNDDADDVVGKILYAKKIFSEKDCDNDRQVKYYQMVKCPFIYGIVELFDAQGHPGSVAISSMMEYSSQKKEPMMIGFSIEGSTLERDGMRLLRTVARRVALTIKPCNKTCVSDILEHIPGTQKAMGVDGFAPLHKSIETELEPYMEKVPNDLANAIYDMLYFRVLAKTLTAGVAAGAPGTNVQGAALQKEGFSRDLKNTIKAKIRDKWDRKTPLAEFLKNELPELGEKFKDHFSELISELSLQKSSDVVSYRHSVSNVPHTKDQKLLIAGIKIRNTDDSSPYRTMNSKGQRVIVRRGHNDENDKLFSSEKAAAYHNLARDFFKLGHHVPMTSAFINPTDRHVHHAVAAIPGVRSGMHPKDHEEYDKTINDLAAKGTLHKLAVMDYILGHSNRHSNNLVIDSQGHPHLISNEKSFSEQPNVPEYWHTVNPTNKIVDHHTREWVSGLNEKELAALMRHNGLTKKHTEDAYNRLVNIKNKLRDQANIMEIYHKE